MPLALPVLCTALLVTVHPATPRHEADLDSLIASEQERALVARIVSARCNLRDRFAF